MNSSLNITAKLAFNQIKTTRSRTIWTIIGIVLSTAMITAVFGFAVSGNELLMERAGDNEFYQTMYRSTMAGLGTFLSAIIVAASIVVVSNAFRVSAGERTVQFGILKSAGATKKQIAQTIIYEGVFLCIIGIPVGIGLGLLINYTGIEIVNYFMKDINIFNPGDPLLLHFILAWQVILLSVAVSFLTVWLSAWFPARKAAKIPAIEAIRGVGDVKVKAKHFRSNHLVGKLFGFEGTLADKSLKRSKRNFRATVVSLTISIFIFIAIGGVSEQMSSATRLFYPDVDANILMGVLYSGSSSFDENHNLIEREQFFITSELCNQITDKLLEFPDTEVFTAGLDWDSYTTVVPKDMFTEKMLQLYEQATQTAIDEDGKELHITLMVTDKKNYVELCKLANVPVGSNVLYNNHTWYHENGRTVLKPFTFDRQTLTTLTVTGYYDGVEFDLPIHGELTGTDAPAALGDSHSIAVIVERLDTVHNVNWFAKTEDNAGFTEYANTVLEEMLPREGSYIFQKATDIEAELRNQRKMGILIMIFVYGFIIMLTLIGLTNVISTISANVRSRSREFAILRSVGMTAGGIKRMLSLESLLCSIKSLIIGVPLGIGGAYLSYNLLDLPIEFGYTIPWISIIQCTLGVFVITWFIMRYSAARAGKSNTIEAIRGIE